MKTIIGAGLSGLICGAINAQSHIFERNPSSFTSHRAILRFRDDKIARALGLDFRSVEVRKAVWMSGREVSPSPRLANLYSLKTRGIVATNSIWNLAPSRRFIAPDDLHARLADICGRRVFWETPVDAKMLLDFRKEGPIVSTIPLPHLLGILAVSPPLHFDYTPIVVSRYVLADCDVFQTIYYPDPALSVFRATITGGLLTVEGMGAQVNGQALALVLQSFGLNSRGDDVRTELHNHKQSFGKINPAPDGPRKALLHYLTTQHGIFSLGRFATWRNILLDDVYEDINAIRRMMSATSYDSTLERMKGS